MNKLKIILILTAVSLLGACASLPQQHIPELGASKAASLTRVAALDQTNHMVQHLDSSGNIVYIQSFGGGGVGLGLMGPLGVAANVKMIESKTNGEVAQLKGKINLKPVAEFSAAAQRAGIALHNPNALVQLSPYLHVVKTTEDSIGIGCGVYIERADKVDRFPVRYIVQLPLSYSLDELASLSASQQLALQESVAKGFDSILAVLAHEPAAQLEQEPKITVLSSFASPRFEYKMAGQLIREDSDIIWIRTVTGVMGLLKEETEIDY
ncbi:hypothetical protein QFX18_14005 [Saccharophagus degradans]|uniref:hypothetical protein n=1 Tax=Saccharophagus degradans TaxID=86304 RepID=UPI002478253B|nr:hypothetical protein [Saccharophagus degradans]WGO97154.1 hypothetical protein QFX18_14005 [Saccharophagus degradans]